MEYTSFEIALFFYFIATIIGVFELFKSTKTTSNLMLISAVIGFAFHTINIISRYVDAGHVPISNFHEATSFFSWSIILFFIVLEIRYNIGLLGSFIMPIGFLLMVASSMLPKEIIPLSPVLQHYLLGIHTLLAFMGNASFAIAFGTGIMYLVQEHYVKSKHPSGLFQRLPNLQILDEINYRLITIGFPLLTLAIITGAIWAQKAWGSYWRWDDPRQVWSLATWLIYAIILHARLLAGWRGRRAAILSILGFATIIIAFFGVKLLKKGLHVFL